MQMSSEQSPSCQTAITSTTANSTSKQRHTPCLCTFRRPADRRTGIARTFRLVPLFRQFRFSDSFSFRTLFSLFHSGSDTGGWGQPIFQLGGGSWPGPSSHHPSSDFRHTSSGDRLTYQQHLYNHKAGSATSYSNSDTMACPIALAAETQRHDFRHSVLSEAIATNCDGCSDISITTSDADNPARPD